MLSSVFRTVIIYFVALVAMRLMGKRQLGELQPSELVTTFLISNVASLCIDEPDLPLLASIVPIFLIAALEILNSTAIFFFPRYGQLLFGRPVTVVQDGKIIQDALSHLRMTPSDLMEALRGKDVLNPEEIIWAVVEPNGTISTVAAPSPNEDQPMLPLLIGNLAYRDNLEYFGLDENWVDHELSRQGLSRSDVLLWLFNGEKTLLVKKEKTAHKGRSGGCV